MKVWKTIYEEKPSKSGEYRVKTDKPFSSIKYAYYDLMQDSWYSDDGLWLQMCITLYVTHWAEIDNK